MINTIFKTSDSIKNGRSLNDIFTYTIAEIGELAEEVNIVTGYSSKQPGTDGIVGEAIDSIICLVDLIKNYQPNISEDEINYILNKKLQKWYNKN